LAKSRFVFGIASPDDLVRAHSSKVMTFCVVQLGMCLKTSMTAIVPSFLTNKCPLVITFTDLFLFCSCC